jgi:hypothetical protein
MSRKQWYNLWHAFRWMRHFTGQRNAFGWLAHLNRNDAYTIMQVILD